MDPPSLDSRKVAHVVSSKVIFSIFRGLTKYETDGNIVLDLAESYSLSDDKKTYIFKLKKDIVWSDNHPITASDFEKTWKKILSPDFPSFFPQFFYNIENAENAKKNKCSLDDIGIKAIDDKTLLIKLKYPCPFFLKLTSFCAFFPIPTHIEKNNPKWAEKTNHFVSNGPFKLKSWDHNNKIIIEKNPLYWDSKNVSIEEVHFHIIENENTALQMFETSELDWIGALYSPFPIDSIPYILQNKDHSIRELGGTTFCAFNVKKFPFNNKNMRKAFNLAINRKKIIKNITQANETIATRYIPPSICKEKISFFKDNDNENAKKHFEKALEELNIERKDIEIVFSYRNDLLFKKQSEFLKEKWEKLFNIKIKLEKLEKKMMWTKLHNHQIQIALAHWITPYNDPTCILDRFKNKENSKNYSNFENEDYKNLLNLAKKETNNKKRDQYLKKAEAIFIEEMPIAPIYHHNTISLKKPHLKGNFVGFFGEPHFDKIYFKKK
jgi:oligopeptide transport system substrate-binding protein